MWYKKAAGRVGKRGRGGERRKEIEVKEGKRERERERRIIRLGSFGRQTDTHTQTGQSVQIIILLFWEYHIISYHITIATNGEASWKR